MNITTGKKQDISALRERLADLFIHVSGNEREGFIVSTTCEPLFCFERRSFDEIEKVVEDTLKSYIKKFHNIQLAKVEFAKEKIEEIDIPIKVLEPISRIRPLIPESVDAAA